MPNAWVIEIKSDESQLQRGLFEFVQIPSTGDRIALRADDGTLHAFGVVQIEHYPTRIPPQEPPREPSTSVYVHWLNEIVAG
jgi:hypothetical protein